MTEQIQLSLTEYQATDEEENIDSDYTTIYQQHKTNIYRYVLSRIGHVEDAQDITAQVFLKAYKNINTYRHEAPIINWLIGIARNLIIDHYRKNQPENTLVNQTEVIAHSSPSLEETLEKKNRLQRVSEALNALSEDRREAISLRLFAGLSNQEIAVLIKKSPEAVAMLVHRGIQDLNTRLGNEETLS